MLCPSTDLWPSILPFLNFGVFFRNENQVLNWEKSVSRYEFLLQTHSKLKISGIHSLFLPRYIGTRKSIFYVVFEIELNFLIINVYFCYFRPIFGYFLPEINKTNTNEEYSTDLAIFENRTLKVIVNLAQCLFFLSFDLRLFFSTTQAACPTRNNKHKFGQR